MVQEGYLEPETSDRWEERRNTPMRNPIARSIWKGKSRKIHRTVPGKENIQLNFTELRLQIFIFSYTTVLCLLAL